MATCKFCDHDFPDSQSLCPHCARPALYPNVRAAEKPDEQSALQVRYQAALDDAEKRNALPNVKEFEDCVTNSQAVIARSLNELQRLAHSDNELYATYYGLLGGGIKIPDGKKWNLLRVLADDTLFEGYKEQIRFAALSLDGIGLSNYGECSLVLRNDMIAHRATVFEENSVIWMERHGIKVAEADIIPTGYRATWSNRAQLAVAKLGNQIEPTCGSDAYTELLLKQGTNSGKDHFIEVHIWGPMTVRTLERAVLTQSGKRSTRAILDALIAKLLRTNVVMEMK